MATDPGLDPELDPELLEAGLLFPAAQGLLPPTEQQRAAAQRASSRRQRRQIPSWTGLLSCFVFRVFCVKNLDLFAI
jgi:hypothetical protein